MTTTAQRYSDYMVSEDHFAHQDESGHNVVYRLLQADASLAGRWLVVGENLGWGSYSLATPRAMVQGWMNSPSHRENILYPQYDEVGVGISSGAPEPGKSDALTYATVFGKVAPPPSASFSRAVKTCVKARRRRHPDVSAASARRACAASVRRRMAAAAARA